METEKRLVHIDELMERLKEEHDYIMCDPDVSSKIKWWEAVCFSRVRKVIEKTPTVEVVLCEECKHRYYNEDNEAYCCVVWGDGFDTFVNQDEFCSRGERKDNERKTD